MNRRSLWMVWLMTYVSLGVPGAGGWLQLSGGPGHSRRMAWAQEPGPQPSESDESAGQSTPAGDVQRLDAVLRRMTAHLSSLQSYRLKVDQQWELESDFRRTGSNQLDLAAEHNGRFRLSVTARPNAGSKLTCAGDDRSLRCWLSFDGQNCYADLPGGQEHCLEDPFILSNLKFSGLDLLLRPDPAAFLLSRASQVQFVEQAEMDGVQTDHFSLTSAVDKLVVDLWISAADPPLLLKTTFLHTFQVGEKQQTVRTTANLNWETEPEFPDSHWTIELPENAQETTDIYSFLVDGSSRSMLGQPAPPVQLKTLDGQPWELSQHAQKDLVAVVFWASDAAISNPRASEIREFIEKYEAKGVVFYLINVGDSPELAREFVESREVVRPVVMDSDREAAAAYGVTSLPTTVVIGKNGIIQSAHVGYTPAVLELIEADLEKLISGQDLVSPNP